VTDYVKTAQRKPRPRFNTGAMEDPDRGFEGTGRNGWMYWLYWSGNKNASEGELRTSLKEKKGKQKFVLYV